MMGAVKDYLKQFTSGAKDQGTAQANTNPTDQGGPTDTGKESGPSIEGFKNWISEKRAELKESFEGAFRSLTDSLNFRRLQRNEIEADAARDAGQRSDALGTQMGAGVYDATETLVGEGAILVAGGVAEKTAAEAVAAIRALRTGTTGAGVVHKHHAWAKYLGGAEKQELVELPRSLHEAYHRGLDQILPRWRGSSYYEGLSPGAQQQMLRDLSDYTRAFDAKHGTQLFDAMKRNGFPGL
jgi:hypothetical protein